MIQVHNATSTADQPDKPKTPLTQTQFDQRRSQQICDLLRWHAIRVAAAESEVPQ